jgi:hypothetical protein
MKQFGIARLILNRITLILEKQVFNVSHFTLLSFHVASCVNLCCADYHLTA